MGSNAISDLHDVTNAITDIGKPNGDFLGEYDSPFKNLEGVSSLRSVNNFQNSVLHSNDHVTLVLFGNGWGEPNRYGKQQNIFRSFYKTGNYPNPLPPSSYSSWLQNGLSSSVSSPRLELRDWCEWRHQRSWPAAESRYQRRSVVIEIRNHRVDSN